MSAIGIVIVTYNSETEIGACLDAAIATGAEVVVVDNASTDGTKTEIARRGVRLIANPSNRGFAAAVNQGFLALNSTYILLLNPDAVIQSGLESLRRACDLPRAGAAGGRLLGLDGDLDCSAPCAVQQPAGAFFMVRRDVWQELGGFDEGFFPLWFEDVDFCRRMLDRGYVAHYVPQAVSKHTGGHSIARIAVEMRQFYWYRSLLRYSARHFNPFSFRVVCLAVLTGALLRMLAETIWTGSLKPLVVYGKVVRLAGRCSVFGWRDGVVSGPHI